MEPRLSFIQLPFRARQIDGPSFCLSLLIITLAVISLIWMGFGKTTKGASEKAMGKESAPRIAITIDDLPWHGSPAPETSRLQATQRLLSVLVERDAPVTGFVNCARVNGQEPILQAWLTAGMQLGNHTSHHLDLNQVEPPEWVADVESCHVLLSKFASEPIRYFRYPNLHYGATEERRKAAAEALTTLNYTVAHVTIDNSEWLLGNAYDRALKTQDRNLQRLVKLLYMQHMLDAVHHFQQIAQEVLGRDITHILLLHANQLAADQLGALLDALRSEGFSFVSLQGALNDPVFAREDVYTGPKGLSWLYRIRPELVESLSWDDAEAAKIRQLVDSKCEVIKESSK